MLCNVDRYHQPDYLAKVPRVRSTSDEPKVTVDLKLTGEERLAKIRERAEKDNQSPVAAGGVAAEQPLVNTFFLEDGSKVPLYGPRDPAQRVHDVYQLLHGNFQVKTHVPLPQETREQYWRRLGEHYIQHFNVCHNPDANPAEDDDEENNAYGDPFYIIDFGRVMEQMARWRAALPMVRPFYAVKCNPFKPLLELLAALGAGFDCASKGEIELVKDLVKDRENEIIFANPCKRVGDLKTAVRLGVRYTTFDNEEEVEKIAAHLPNAKAVLRLATDDSAAVCAFSSKFGARRSVVEHLLQRAAELKVDVCGVSFHVGSGNSDPKAYLQSLQDAKETFALAKKYGHMNCNFLDIGGGYPGAAPGLYEQAKNSASHGSPVSFEVIAAAMRPVLERDFAGVTIISEPGRYFTEASHALFMHVYARRLITHPGKLPEEKLSIAPALSKSSSINDSSYTEYQYYVNDGLYHSFNCILYDHAHPHLLLMKDHEGVDLSPPTGNGKQQRQLHISSIYGPTCDSLDCILKEQPFPEMRVGDWVLAPDMGSYTTAAGCPFNGIATRRRVYVSSIQL